MTLTSLKSAKGSPKGSFWKALPARLVLAILMGFGFRCTKIVLGKLDKMIKIDSSTWELDTKGAKTFNSDVLGQKLYSQGP